MENNEIIGIQVDSQKIFEIHLTDEYKIENKVLIFLKEPPMNYLFELQLWPLWLIDDKFIEGDYYQQVFRAEKFRMGYGTIVHDFLINRNNELPFQVNSVYSSKTNSQEKGYFTVEAKAFWDKQVKYGKAEYVSSLERYKLLII